MNIPPKSNGAGVCAALAILCLALCGFFAFATSASESADIPGAYPDCGTGQNTDVGCYYREQAAREASIARTEAEMRIGQTFVMACGFAAVALAGCAVAFGVNRGPSWKDFARVVQGKGPGGPAVPHQPGPGAAPQPFPSPQQPGAPGAGV